MLREGSPDPELALVQSAPDLAIRGELYLLGVQNAQLASTRKLRPTAPRVGRAGLCPIRPAADPPAAARVTLRLAEPRAPNPDPASRHSDPAGRHRGDRRRAA